MAVTIGLNTIWVVLAAAMVIFMEGGFSLLEAGFVRTRNAGNVTMKIFVDLTFGALVFYLLGFALMFAGDFHGILGGSILNPLQHIHVPNGLPPSAFMLFQLAFAMAVASIISGAVAERMKFTAYIVTILFVCGFVYPISGHWIWGTGGWLAHLGMKDFAGSAAIHELGGFAAFAFMKVLGPRKNRFNKDGSVNVFAPSNIPLASAGAFILWFGWFGFNAGSTLNAMDPNLPNIALNTFLAAAAGGASAILLSIWKFKVADPSMAINGSLAGLVAVTAGCAYYGNLISLLVGLSAGVLVIFGTGWVDRLKVDDPVGAFAVHGLNGMLGTLAVGLFDRSEGLVTTGHFRLFIIQIAGVLVVALWGYFASYGIGWVIRSTIGIRVTPAEEEVGLDIVAHGIPAYNELERFSDVSLPGVPYLVKEESRSQAFSERTVGAP